MGGRIKTVYTLKNNLDTSMGYVVLANGDRLTKHRHAWKVWHALKDFGCRVYVSAPDLTTFEGSRIYPDLHSLKGKFQVVIPCLKAEFLTNLVDEADEAGAEHIWFQEKNWTPELADRCREKGIEALRGCLLKHKVYKKPWAFFNPCYWHGLQENKVPSKYHRI